MLAALAGGVCLVTEFHGGRLEQDAPDLREVVRPWGTALCQAREGRLGGVQNLAAGAVPGCLVRCPGPLEDRTDGGGLRAAGSIEREQLGLVFRQILAPHPDHARIRGIGLQQIDLGDLVRRLDQQWRQQATATV